MTAKRTYLLGDTCPHCDGNGRIPSRCDRWRTGWKEDGHYQTQEHETLAEALGRWSQGNERWSGAVNLIAPDGRFLTDVEVEELMHERTPAPQSRVPSMTNIRRVRDAAPYRYVAPFRVLHTYQCGERELCADLHSTLAEACKVAVRSRRGPLGTAQMLAVLDANGYEAATIDPEGTVVHSRQLKEGPVVYLRRQEEEAGRG